MADAVPLLPPGDADDDGTPLGEGGAPERDADAPGSIRKATPRPITATPQASEPSPRPNGATPRPNGATPRPITATPRPSGATPSPASVRRRDADGAPAAPRVVGGAATYPMPGLVSSAPPPPVRARDHAGGRKEEPGADAPGPPRPPSAVHLSPRMTAIFGGIFGLATVTSVVALLIQAVPPRDERAIIAGTAATGSGAVSAESGDAPPVVRKKARTAIPGPWRLSELDKDPSLKIETGTTDRKSLFVVLGDRGVPKAQVYRILKSLDGVRKFDKTGRRDRFAVAFERATKRVKAFEYEVSPSEIYQVREGDTGLLAGGKLDLKIAEEEASGAFYIGSDLAASYASGGFEDGLLVTLDEAMNGKLSTESFEEGGTVRVIAAEETALGLFSRYKRVIALEYRPPDPAAKPVRFYHFNGKDARGYWDEKGRQPYAGGWRNPVPGAPVTSRFNPKRLHPILKTVMPHNGTDFGAPTGTPIYAAYRGVVTFVGPHGATGNWVAIEHPNGVETGYAHMSRFAPGIKVGDKVGTHQLIGYVGTTGRSTGPHLHFSARKKGVFFDAETLHLDGDRPVPSGDRQAFLAAKAELDRRLDAIPLPEPPPEKPRPPAAVASGSAGPAPDAPPVDENGKRPKGGGAVVIGSPAALASAAAEPGIHPSKFVEVSGEEDDDVPVKAPDGAKAPGKPNAAPPPDEPDDDDEN